MNTLIINDSKENTINELSSVIEDNYSLGFDEEGNIESFKDNTSIYLQIFSHDQSLQNEINHYGFPSINDYISYLIDSLESQNYIEFSL